MPIATPDVNVFKGRRVLITGGLGFIGSTLAHRLVSAGAKVTVVDSVVADYGGNMFNVAGIEHALRVNIADVRDVHSLRYLVQGEEYLFNLAGQTSHVDSMRDPYTDLEINCRSQLSILETCRQYNPAIKIVFASTRQLYGRPAYLPVDELHGIRPVDVNGINKLAGEMYHMVYNDVHGIRACALRLTNTYGPRMRVKDARQTFLGAWIRQLLHGKPITVYGDGRQVRDFNYVDDVVDALLSVVLMDRANGEIFNLGGCEACRLIDVAQLLVDINGGGTIEMQPFPEEVRRIDIGDYYSDYTRIRDALGWQPKIELREGLTRTLAYYREHGAHYWGTEG